MKRYAAEHRTVSALIGIDCDLCRKAYTAREDLAQMYTLPLHGGSPAFPPELSRADLCAGCIRNALLMYFQVQSITIEVLNTNTMPEVTP